MDMPSSCSFVTMSVFRMCISSRRRRMLQPMMGENLCLIRSVLFINLKGVAKLIRVRLATSPFLDDHNRKTVPSVRKARQICKHTKAASRLHCIRWQTGLSVPEFSTGDLGHPACRCICQLMARDFIDGSLSACYFYSVRASLPKRTGRQNVYADGSRKCRTDGVHGPGGRHG